MANKRLQTKANEFVVEVEDARNNVLAITKEHEKVIEEYTEALIQYQAASDRLKGFCAEHFDEFLGEKVGPLSVGSSRKASPQMLIEISGLEHANRYITYKPTLALTTLAEAVRQGDITEEIVDAVCDFSPQIKGSPKVQLDLKL